MRKKGYANTHILVMYMEKYRLWDHSDPEKMTDLMANGKADFTLYTYI